MIKLPKGLIKETKTLCHIRAFLDEIGLGKYRVSVKALKKIKKILDNDCKI